MRIDVTATMKTLNPKRVLRRPFPLMQLISL
jgi:hypothetical protein